jgi:hypothetical protein
VLVALRPLALAIGEILWTSRTLLYYNVGGFIVSASSHQRSIHNPDRSHHLPERALLSGADVAAADPSRLFKSKRSTNAVFS